MQKITQIITQIIDFLYYPFQRWIPLQIFRYAACGGVNMVLDWVLYFITYNYIVGHEIIYFYDGAFAMTPHILSLCIVFPITLMTGFLLNKYVTFTQSTIRGTKQLARYILIVGINLVVNYIGLKILVEMLGWYPTPSKITITLFTIVISFLGQKYFSFKE